MVGGGCDFLADLMNTDDGYEWCAGGSDERGGIEDGHRRAFCIVIPDILLRPHGPEDVGGGQ